MGNVQWSRYRHGCGAIIVNDEGLVLVARRTNAKSRDVGTWQYPQGGVGDVISGRSESDLILGIERELMEEIGLEKEKHGLTLLTRLSSHDQDLHYNYYLDDDPSRPTVQIQKGQRQAWFLFHWPSSEKCRNENPMEVCTLNNMDPAEFDLVNWKSMDEALDLVAKNKHAMYVDLHQRVRAFLQEHPLKATNG